MRETNRIKIVCIVGLIIVFILGLVYVFYQLGDNGRWIRDHGIYSSGISDSEVKSIWCVTQGFQEPYEQIDGKQFCGEIEVEIQCIFSNSGDYCSINKYEDAGI